jgi:hypothetical protein
MDSDLLPVVNSLTSIPSTSAAAISVDTASELADSKGCAELASEVLA